MKQKPEESLFCKVMHPRDILGLNSFRGFYPHYTDMPLACIKIAHMADLRLVPVLVGDALLREENTGFHHKLFLWTSQSLGILVLGERQQ